MPTQIQCPSCSSANVMFSKKRDVLICRDCQHESLSEKVVKPMRNLLSYGRAGDEEQAHRIKSDSEQRGYGVWSGQTENKCGDEWRRSITDGILNSQRVVSFLSEPSTRDPGVCRDENAIAVNVYPCQRKHPCNL